MRAALAIQDRQARAAAIVAARQELALSANKPLTASAIARVDSLLGIQGAPSRLGAVREDRRDFERIAFDARHDFRDFRGDPRDFGLGLGHGFGFSNVAVDPARLEARAAALDRRSDRVEAEIRASADRRAHDIVARAEARAAELRALEATAQDPARLEARAVDIVNKANARAAEIVARADVRAAALDARVDARVADIRAVAAYDRAMTAAMALDDTTQRAAAVTAARTDLRTAFDRPLSAHAIDRLDDRLGFEDAPPATPVSVASAG